MSAASPVSPDSTADPVPGGPRTVRQLRQELESVDLRTAARVGRELERVRGRDRGEPGTLAAALPRLAGQLVGAAARTAARAASVPPLRYPDELPITARVPELSAALGSSQVVVVAGETGSGKTTQLPKVCLGLGRGVRGMIGHTQPRRLAARAVAERLAEELGTTVGGDTGTVGYAVRFTDRVGPRALVKVMTDGILLAEATRDPMLRAYDTLIVNEAHERSLNIDFLLGYLHGLLPRRPELKLVITSATIDPHRFAAHFGDAPVIEVSGRTYPVRLRYRPLLPDLGDAGDAGERDGDGDGADGDGGDGAGGARPGRPPGEDSDGGDLDEQAPAEVRDQAQAVVDAVAELSREPAGDILVFLSGEREIRDTADALSDWVTAPGGHREVLPLYARLSAAEQHRVFAPHPGRRVVLSTNVAETSLTVPGIRYVVDAGTARISRYSRRTGVQRLPIEPVSRASADQRAGRCGRVAPGICIRLYSRADYESRPRFTDPEILRTNLASVVLAMAQLGLGEVADFGFLDPPDPRAVRDGIALLHELGALAEPGSAPPPRSSGSSGSPESPESPESAGSSGSAGSSWSARRRGRGRGPGPAVAGRVLTPIGRRLAELPVDPRLARMVLAAEPTGCLPEVLVIVAALSVADPRERPAAARADADRRHARFADPTSDFLSMLNLWRYLRSRQRELSRSAFRRLCRAEYLHTLRIREWQDLVGQLRQVVRSLGMHAGDVGGRFDPDDTDESADLGEDGGGEDGAGGEPWDGDGARGHRPAADGEGSTVADPATVHRAVLTGLLSHIGMREEDGREFRGARGTRFAVFPGSALSRRPPRWVMAAELVETSRLFARTVARIDPAWVEPAAEHLLTRSYAGPHWSRRQSAVLASETVTLFGLPVVAGRPVVYGGIDPAASREIFLRAALVEGDWDTRHPFAARNRALLSDIETLQEQARRRDLRVEDDALFAFYDARVPAEVVSGSTFDRWWRGASRRTPDLLDFPAALVAGDAAAEVRAADYPREWHSDGVSLPLTYRFAPGSPEDGVTVQVPLPVLDRVDPGVARRSVPGYREDLVTELIRTLPKSLRRNFAPAREHARAVLSAIGPDADPTPELVAGELTRGSGVRVPVTALDPDALPGYLRPTFRVHDADGQTVAESKALGELQRRLAPRTAAALSAAARHVERTGLTAWPGGTLARTVELPGRGGTGVGYPALVDEASTVAVRVLRTPGEQAAAMTAGTRRLLVLGGPSPLGTLRRRLGGQGALALAANPDGSLPALLADCVDAAVDALVAEHGGPAWDAAGFAALSTAVRSELVPRAEQVLDLLVSALAEARAVDGALAALTGPTGHGSAVPAALADSVADIRDQLAGLLFRGFVTALGPARLPALVRYLRAANRRVDVLVRDPGRDRDRTAVIRELVESWRRLVARIPAEDPRFPRLADLRWSLEELRVSLFAQGLGTPEPVSAKRVRRALDALG